MEESVGVGTRWRVFKGKYVQAISTPYSRDVVDVLTLIFSLCPRFDSDYFFMCMWVTIIYILWVYGAFAFVSPSHFMWNDDDKGPLVDDSNNAIFCLSQSVSLVLMLLTGLAAVSWCCSRKSWMCMCLLAGSCVSRPVCVSMCSGGSIPSPYGQCVSLGWTALCVRQQECHRLRVIHTPICIFIPVFYILFLFIPLYDRNRAALWTWPVPQGLRPPQPQGEESPNTRVWIKQLFWSNTGFFLCHVIRPILLLLHIYVALHLICLILSEFKLFLNAIRILIRLHQKA